ncbi:MFS transporter [Candidatus Fermentibacteria bacterium]|nr:MFS transporter [Candidatus Fermentibacteria bacterium]
MPYRIARHLTDYRGHVGGFSADARRLLLGQALSATGLAVYGVFFNVYLNKGGLGEDFIGALASVTMITSVIIGIPAGILASRVGLRNALLAALPLVAIISALQSLTVDRGALLTLAVILGGGQMLFNAALYPLLTVASNPADRNYVFSLSWAIMSLAGVVGALVGGLMPHVVSLIFGYGEFHALRVALFCSALLACASLLPTRHIAPRRGPAPPVVRLSAYSQILRQCWKFAILNVIIGLGAGFTIPFLSLYFSTVFQLRPSTIGAVFAVSGAVTGLAVLVTPLLVRRFGKLYAMLIPQAVSIPFLVMLAHSRLLMLSVPAFWVRGALMNAGTPVMNQVVMEGSSEEHRPIVNNLISLSWNIGWSVSVALSGVIIKRHGYMIPFYTTILVYIAYIIVLYRFFRGDPAMRRTADT